MSAAPKSTPSKPAGFPDTKTDAAAPVNIDPLLQSILGRGARHFGIVAAVLQGGCIIAQGVAGVRQRGTAQPITINDKFHLGSCGKAMTATLVALLVEEGTLSWTTTLGEVFADTVKPLHPAWAKVTVRQLLAHRAGLRFLPAGQVRVFNHLFLAPYANSRNHPKSTRPLKARLDAFVETLPQQRLEIARHALSRPPKIPPGAKFWYSNEGYTLAGAMLEHLTGRPWEDLMRERLFQPLGITTGGFGPPGTADKTDQPWGHSTLIGQPLDPGNPAAEFPLCYAPAGLAHMTIADWAKFIGLHLRGDPANPHCQPALLQPDTFAEMHAVAPAANYFKGGWVTRWITRLLTGDATPAVTYRAGWVISSASWAKGTRPGDTGRRLWHAGSNGMWSSAVSIAPEIDFAVLVACNRGPDIAAWKTRQTAKALIQAYAPKRTS